MQTNVLINGRQPGGQLGSLARVEGGPSFVVTLGCFAHWDLVFTTLAADHMWDKQSECRGPNLQGISEIRKYKLSDKAHMLTFAEMSQSNNSLTSTHCTYTNRFIGQTKCDATGRD